VQKKTRSLLDELDIFVSKKDNNTLIENRANNVIKSAINLLEHIRQNYDADTAANLEKRLLNSIRTGEPEKFTRGIRRVKRED
jgi:hypothetical protein